MSFDHDFYVLYEECYRLSAELVHNSNDKFL